MDRGRNVGPGLEGAAMRKILRSACFAVAATGLLLTLSLPAAGAQAGTVGPAAGPLHGPALPARPAVSGSFSVLYGVYCNSARDCWAVGQREVGTAYENEIMHWNGKSWKQTKTPNPGGTSAISDNELYVVRCLTTKDCWAVGEYQKGKAWLGEALHWNGKKWYATKVPAVAGTGKDDKTELFDSTCVATDNCWAVGDFGLGTPAPEKLLNLVLHWNGKKWTQVRPLPNPGGTKLGDLNYLDAVRCISAANCNAVGSYGSASVTKNNNLNEVLHWNGKKWSWVHVPNPAGTGKEDDDQLVGLACGASNSCWGAGYSGKNVPETFRNQILHWNGAKWTTVKVPDPGGTKSEDQNLLFADTCDGPANCWAVGDYHNSHGATVNEAVHWNGKRWYYVGTPNPAGSQSLDMNYLYAVRCTSSANCWAVGGSQPYLGTDANEILHWNGKKWTVFPA
jgi:hypothetical protein